MKKKNLMLDVGLANEIKMAARRAGATEADLKALAEGNLFAILLPVIRGYGEVSIRKFIIDLDDDSVVPAGCEVFEHIKGGQFLFNPARITLIRVQEQRGESQISGHELWKKLKGGPVLNANMLDFFLSHPCLIPAEWTDLLVFFWGTIYRSQKGNQFVRFLFRDKDKWHWNFQCLDIYWKKNAPAAILLNE